MKSNDKLIDYLKGRNYIKTEEIEQAFRNVDRAYFIPEEHQENSYADNPLPIGHGATISAPHMVAMNTELLDIEEDSRVLEIGSGSGYQLAIIAEIAEESVGVEIIEALAEKSRENLENWPNTEIIHGEGLKVVEGEFDRVLFSCSVELERVDEAREHLVDEGIILAPVKTDSGQVLKKFKDSEVENHSRVRFVEYKESSEL